MLQWKQKKPFRLLRMPERSAPSLQGLEQTILTIRGNDIVIVSAQCRVVVVYGAVRFRDNSGHVSLY